MFGRRRHGRHPHRRRDGTRILMGSNDDVILVGDGIVIEPRHLVEISDQTIQTIRSVFQVSPQPSALHLLAVECRKLLDLLAVQHSYFQ